MIHFAFTLHVHLRWDRDSLLWHPRLGNTVDGISTTWNVDFFVRREGTITNFTAALKGLYADVIYVTSTHILLTKASYVTTPSFDGTKKYNIPERRAPEITLATTTRIEGNMGIQSQTLVWSAFKTPREHVKWTVGFVGLGAQRSYLG